MAGDKPNCLLSAIEKKKSTGLQWIFTSLFSKDIII